MELRGEVGLRPEDVYRGGEVEVVGHLVMRCTYVEEKREKLEELMSDKVE